MNGEQVAQRLLSLQPQGALLQGCEGSEVSVSGCHLLSWEQVAQRLPHVALLQGCRTLSCWCLGHLGDGHLA